MSPLLYIIDARIYCLGCCSTVFLTYNDDILFTLFIEIKIKAKRYLIKCDNKRKHVIGRINTRGLLLLMNFVTKVNNTTHTIIRTSSANCL